MKKIAIIIALVSVTALAALTVSGKENKTESAKVKIEHAETVTPSPETTTLATAD